jgi:hypothetical protein
VTLIPLCSRVAFLLQYGKVLEINNVEYDRTKRKDRLGWGSHTVTLLPISVGPPPLAFELMIHDDSVQATQIKLRQGASVRLRETAQ